MPYDLLASEEAIIKTADALKKRNINAEIVADRAAALKLLMEIIPPGASIMTGGSVTLEEIKFVDLLKSKDNPWVNWKNKIFSEPDQAKQMQLRKESSMADYYLASAHAISEDGAIIQASFSGSQIPAFAMLSPHAILVVGCQKIMMTEEDAIRRVKEYSLPMEDKHQKAMGNAGSTINKLLVTYGDMTPGRITVILVKEKLGF